MEYFHNLWSSSTARHIRQSKFAGGPARCPKALGIYRWGHRGPGHRAAIIVPRSSSLGFLFSKLLQYLMSLILHHLADILRRH
jgi:hypothetical protein